MAFPQLLNNKYQETLNLTLTDATNRNLVRKGICFNQDYISVTSTCITFNTWTFFWVIELEQMACSQLSNNKYQETLNLTLNDTTNRNLVKEKAFDWDYISVTSTNITFYIETLSNSQKSWVFIFLTTNNCLSWRAVMHTKRPLLPYLLFGPKILPTNTNSNWKPVIAIISIHYQNWKKKRQFASGNYCWLEQGFSEEFKIGIRLHFKQEALKSPCTGYLHVYTYIG